jgi:hypothetical protein
VIRRSVAAALALTAVTVLPAVADACGAPPSFAPLSFSAPLLIDDQLAGGEPSIQPLADGSLLYSSHAGTTHLYKPPTDPHDPTGWASTYTGSINTWRSVDGGTSWTPSPLFEQSTGALLPEGFSDPSTAVDRAGNVYLSAIDTVTVYVGRSEDGSRFVGNKLASFNMDREWIAADTPGVVYMIATPMQSPWPNTRGEPLDPTSDRVLWRSVTGGADWEEPFGRELPGGGPMSPIQVNPVDGSLWWPATDYNNPFVPEVYEWPNARDGDLDTVRVHRILDWVPHSGGFFNVSAFDDAGNHYVAWNSNNEVGLHYTVDGGATYERTSISKSADRLIRWPWIAAGGDGRVALAWLERAPSTQEWRVKVAASKTAHGWTDGCGNAKAPMWQTTTATAAPMHVGAICESGLSCNSNTGTSGDRRLGDYFTIAITPAGQLVVAYGDTAHDPGAAVSHPAFIKQVSGLDFR